VPTNIHLTDSDSDVAGYLAATIGKRSDVPSLVRAVVNTAAGPSAGIQWTRTAAGTALAWLTPPLDGADLTAAAWVLRLWASESNAAANAAIRVQVYQWVVGEAGTALLDNNAGTELGTTSADVNITTGVATATTMADGDRLVIKVLIDDAGTLATGYTATLAYNGEAPRAEGDSYLTCPDTLAVTAAVPTASQTTVRRNLKVASTASDYTVELSNAEINQAVGQALRTFSRDRPRLVTGAISGDGSATAFRLPRLWVQGFSGVPEVEYPTGNTPRTVIESEEWEILDSVLGTQPTRLFSFRNGAPASGTDNIRLRYTTVHRHDDEQDSIPPNDLDAFLWLASSYCAATLAARQANSSDSTIAADSVNYRDGESRWRSVAKYYQGLYDQHLGRGKDAVVAPAGAVRDWDSAAMWGDRLTHSRRYR